MDLYNFLPKYPNIENNELDPYNGENFNQVIYNKKEFRELKLSKFENIQQGQLLKHQKIISRFISSYTPYDGILLFHYMGTGKTCSAISVAENSDKKIMVILSASLVNNFKEKLLFPFALRTAILERISCLSLTFFHSQID